MWLNRNQRLKLLLKHLLLQPQHVPAYLMHLPAWGRSPLDLGLPWWSYGAIQRCTTLIGPESRAFEFGTGGSTVFLAQRVKFLECVEDSDEWRTAVERALRTRGLRNCTLHQATLPSAGDDDAHWPDYLRSIQGKYDLIVVDCQDLPGLEFGADGGLRERCFFHCEDYVKRGGAIVVDDAWRYVGLRGRSKARCIETFESVGPARVGVTTTDIYFY